MSETTPAAVAFDHVTTVLGGRAVLDDVSFAIQPGESVCVLGKSGTGKSVTLKTIMGLMTPDAGRVFVEGEEVTDAPRHVLSEIRQRLGFLFQNAALFDSISVGENVAFPLRRHTDYGDREIDETVERGVKLLARARRNILDQLRHAASFVRARARAVVQNHEAGIHVLAGPILGRRGRRCAGHEGRWIAFEAVGHESDRHPGSVESRSRAHGVRIQTAIALADHAALRGDARRRERRRCELE